MTDSSWQLAKPRAKKPRAILAGVFTALKIPPELIFCRLHLSIMAIPAILAILAI
ncbi:MAG: hypothetical protein LAO78_12840 [Acidobacteriia bacterium]|nr:hypothetical protein [Terriglobia bacterium]